MFDHDAGPVSKTTDPPTKSTGEAAQGVASRERRRRVDGRLIVLLVVVALYSRGR